MHGQRKKKKRLRFGCTGRGIVCLGVRPPVRKALQEEDSEWEDGGFKNAHGHSMLSCSVCV